MEDEADVLADMPDVEDHATDDQVLVGRLDARVVR